MMPSSASTAQGLSHSCHAAERHPQNLLAAAEARHGEGLAQALRKGLKATTKDKGGKKL